MLITISSRNETDNARFSNYLQDTLVIKPFSKIALINASIVVSDSNAFIQVPDNQFFDVMFDAWNIYRIPMVGGTYTLNDWVNTQNSQSEMTNTNSVYYLEFEDTNNVLSLNFYLHQDKFVGENVLWRDDFGYSELVDGQQYGENNYWRLTTANEPCVSYLAGLNNGAFGGNQNLDGILTDGTNPMEIVTHFNTGNNDWSYTNGGEKYDWGRYMGEVFCCVGAGSRNVFTLQVNSFNEANNEYTTGTGNKLLTATFLATNLLEIKQTDISGNETIKAAGAIYYPGAALHIKAYGSPTGAGVGDYQLGQKVSIYQPAHGTNLWIPFDLTTTGAWEFNDGQGNIGKDVRISTRADTPLLALNSFYVLGGINNAKFGWRAGNGQSYINDEYVNQVGGVLGNPYLATQMPNNGSFRMVRANGDRYRLFKRGADATTGAGGTTLFSTAESLDTSYPSLLVISFNVQADGTASNVIYGTDADWTLRINVGNVPNNIQFKDAGGTTRVAAFGGHTIVAGNSYTLGIATFGNFQVLGNHVIRVILMESDGSYHFLDVTTSATDKALQGINCIGGPSNYGGTSNSFNGCVWDFRYIQHNEGQPAIAGTTYWDAIFQEIANYTINTNNAGATKPEDWFCVYKKNPIWTPSAQTDFNMTFASNGINDMFQWVCERAAGVNIQNNLWFDMTNMVFTDQATTYSGGTATQQTAINAESEGALEVRGVGLINATGTGAINPLKLTPADSDNVTATLSNSDFTFANAVAELGNGAGDEVIHGQLEEAHNVDIKNLPIVSKDGHRHQRSKTIYQLPSVGNTERTIGDVIYKSYPVPQKVFIELNNSGDIVLNQLDIEITDETGKPDERLEGVTNLSIEII